MVYNYTKPRGPIAAMYSSPGPAYALPPTVGKTGHDPRSTKQIMPAYSFGLRHGAWKDEAGPGPSYYPNPKYLRDGKDGTPAYSLYSRQKDLACMITPGPGAYQPEKTTNVVKYKDPAYSFGLKTETRSSDNTPGMRF